MNRNKALSRLPVALLLCVAGTACGDDLPAMDAPGGAVTPPPPSPPADPGFVDSVPEPEAPAFIDGYRNNVAANSTPATNPVLALLSGFSLLWSAGATWDTGTATALGQPVLAANIQYVVDLTTSRTPEQADAAYYDDRRNQSYSVVTGLGPLAPFYLAGSGSATTITSIPDDATSVRYDDGGTGAGDPSGPLGSVVALVGQLRGPFSSTTPAKSYFQYPRPYRQSLEVIVVPTLVPAESPTPASDGGFTSGHTNAAYLASLALAHAIPERFQEMLARASELGHNRIMAGMHSPMDVMGGRVMATALAAAILNDPENATARADAYAQAHAYLETQTGTDDDALHAFAHSADASADRFADREKQGTAYRERLTYGFAPVAATTAEMVVPKGAEVLLETRFPYLDAMQRRVVLRTTGIASGYPLLDDPEGWGRLDLYAAADGYGEFNGNVFVTMDASSGGFHASDTWRNDIAGPGKLTKRGSGALQLTGDNSYSGGTQLEEGTLAAGSPSALGEGDVYAAGGTLASRAAAPLRVGGDYTQLAEATLELRLGSSGAGRLTVAGTAALLGGTLLVAFRDGYLPSPGDTLDIIASERLLGTFGAVEAEGFSVTPLYTDAGVLLQIDR